MLPYYRLPPFFHALNKIQMALYILEDEYCRSCDGYLELDTEAEQNEDFDFIAFDNDEAKCLDCGKVHFVHADEDGAYITE